MTNKNEIKIFLACSNEMKEDRNNIERLIRSKNDEWQKLNKPSIRLEIWEDQSEAMSPTHSQDEYNKIILKADIFIMLFWHKVGDFTKEEFLIAKEHFTETEKPLILVYQKECKEENKFEASAKDFKNENKNYFFGQYDYFDTLALKLHKEIDGFYNEQKKVSSSFENNTSKTINQQADKIYNIDNIDNATFN